MIYACPVRCKPPAALVIHLTCDVRVPAADQRRDGPDGGAEDLVQRAIPAGALPGRGGLYSGRRHHRHHHAGGERDLL